ncbi:MAG: hypothetical protein ABFD21_02755, partial [Anaerolineaceae bacterium]
LPVSAARFFAGGQDDRPEKGWYLVCRLGAATQERNPTTAPQTRRPKLVGLRCRSTRPTTTLCRVALPLHPTYDL